MASTGVLVGSAVSAGGLMPLLVKILCRKKGKKSESQKKE